MTDQRPAGYSPRLHNDDLGPVPQKWTWYNILAFWMSDVHSVGGYVFAASLFALGLASWQVLIALLIGICIIQVIANLVAKPSQQAAVPYPVICRLAFGVFGANIPAIIRGLIAVAWYGIQTYLASSALVIVVLRFFPDLAAYQSVTFLGLSWLGWFGFLALWVVQAAVFWTGMESIRRFIDWAGPAVYAVMFALAGWIVWRAGWDNISFTLAEKELSGWAAFGQVVMAIALVVSYFSGPTLNFGDFSRYCRSMADVRRGNFWGLPVNFLAFSLVTVVIVSGTLPIFGEMIHDPIATVARIDNTTAVLLGAFTFVTATVGINIVANFVSPAFDFANVAPSRISWRVGGMIAAVASIFITPWNLFNNPEVIHYTLDVLAACIGPLFGILLVDYYLIKKQQIDVDALFNDTPSGRYWYTNGINWIAVKALLLTALVGLCFTFIEWFKPIANFAWFTGCILGGALFYAMTRWSPVQAANMPTPVAQS
ncbi:NCS1 family nucleobase:cation symporter-1 [Pseudomonas syringae]|uniref:NCS1 family nucleobase:cation symporter-1 n=1 Tax=Pseudomonas syringae TaxID=317 RepID=UPI00020993AF|nr:MULTISPECIES: NCS1 family nucleobase:cation symporter-1 [Pseudomonas syringae group]EGH97545.1 cytosine/purine/uracil/thiamine/allantoin permease family protein [Pseudomonas amygdali pv. lachrymans str. M302278]KPC07290.1 Cytosine/purine/uracil/thiamine/allantoin permease family protein [Pseudomonas amygdali pv. lachrymans]RMM14954.1 Cytosine/purine/uracil/thiaminee/allantoin permease protein [Pseudomonas syringae]